MYITIENSHFILKNDITKKILHFSNIEFGGLNAKIPDGYRYSKIVKNKKDKVFKILNMFPEIKEQSDDNYFEPYYYIPMRKIKLLSLTDNKLKKKLPILLKLLKTKYLVTIWKDKPFLTGSSG